MNTRRHPLAAADAQNRQNPAHAREDSFGLTFPAELVEAIAERVAVHLAEQQQKPAAPQETGKLALSKAEAAEALGMSVDHLERHVLPDLRIVRSGRLRLIPLTEIEAWLDRSASRTLAGA